MPKWEVKITGWIPELGENSTLTATEIVEDVPSAREAIRCIAYKDDEDIDWDIVGFCDGAVITGYKAERIED